MWIDSWWLNFTNYPTSFLKWTGSTDINDPLSWINIVFIVDIDLFYFIVLLL